MAPGDVAARPFCRKAAGPVLEIGLGVEHIENPARPDPRAGNQPPALGDLVDRRIELGEIQRGPEGRSPNP